MDQSKPLSDFFTAIEKYWRIGITHIGIYAALLKLRTDKGFANPIEVFGRDIRHVAKGSARMTCGKCLKELSEYGYIQYEPSYKRTEGSRIYFL